MTASVPARQLMSLVLDRGSYQSWDTGPLPVQAPADGKYAAALAAAKRSTGSEEATITGEGRIQGRRVAVAVCEFGFLAGSIGVAAAERLVSCVERATAERLPLVASPASGGTRMQEGTVAFLQMVKISAVVARHRVAGLLYFRLSASPDHRRTRLLGVAGPCHRRTARSAHRFPRPARVRGAL
jgi:acetyl-CoA carboxylase carboxyl transferase subunit beta